MKTRGGAVVELVLWMGLLTLVLGFAMSGSHIILWRLRLISVARLAATLAGTGRVDAVVIDEEVRSYLRLFPNANSAALDFSLTRFTGVPSAPFYQLISADLRLALPKAVLEESVRVQQEDVS